MRSSWRMSYHLFTISYALLHKIKARLGSFLNDDLCDTLFFRSGSLSTYGIYITYSIEQHRTILQIPHTHRSTTKSHMQIWVILIEKCAMGELLLKFEIVVVNQQKNKRRIFLFRNEWFLYTRIINKFRSYCSVIVVLFPMFIHWEFHQ